MNLPQNVTCCVCSSTGNPYQTCWGNDGFQEKGKQVKLRARSGEAVKAVVIDDCLLSGQQTKKCDGLFIFISGKGNNKKVYIVLVELKGTNIEAAFEQLASVKHCPEYQEITAHFARKINSSKPVKLIERSFIVTCVKMPPRRQQDELEGFYEIRVDIRTSAQTGAKALDLREYL